MRRHDAAVAALAIAAAVLAAAERGVLQQPGLGAAALAASALPFVIAAPYPKLFRLPLVVIPIVVVLAAAGLLMWLQPNPQFALFIFYILLTARVATDNPLPLSLATAGTGVLLPILMHSVGPDTATKSVGIALAWLAGLAIRSQDRAMMELFAAQAALAEQAAMAERQRIAREIHDLVAHTLSVTMLHLTGARLALDEHETAEARDALTQAEQTGREALREMRQTVGLLGTPTTGEALPGAADIPALVSSYKNAGLDVTLDLEGDLGQLTGDVGLALYRITQESLSNAVKHASPSRAAISLSIDAATARVTVRSPYRERRSGLADGGFGIPGMKQRAALLGGQLAAGPRGDSWQVIAELPRASA